MRVPLSPAALLLCLQAFLIYSVAWNFTDTSLVPRQISVFDDRPDGCPPCFNCNLDDFKCQQFANCSATSGRCDCPPGFGGNDCADPLCGSLAGGKDRAPRGADEPQCACDEGWEGINCNVCKTNDACNALMPENQDGICYRDGLVQKQNHQICDITNKKIIEILDPKLPQVTFSCSADDATCNFQFWVDQRESFYCDLDTCTFNLDADPDRNTTKYDCEHLKCRCIPGRMLCGENGALDIGEFLEKSIKGPASFSSVSSYSDKTKDGSKFEEPAMNGLISQVFGDSSITLRCGSGECLYKTDVPGYEKPVKTINTPLIAGVISGCALFVVLAVLVIVWLSRKTSARNYGLVRLADEDEADSALMADHKPASLHFENVSYRVGGRQILSGVQGAIHPGEIMAIMGSSGAGKTTFLDLLARKNKRGVGSGNFYINGEQVPDSEFRSFVGFVDQDDTLLPTLTVHETILDSAMLRLPKDMPFVTKEQKVEDVERQLGIFHIRDQLIGSEDTNRGISGGEKRRVSIACELVTSPSILFLDEPTSGLDAYNAYNVVECLVNLVKTYNRTVIFTIHQPRSNIVALFDRLVLLAKGRTVYSGSFSKCQQYFDSIGYACPPGFNIADYLVDLTMHAGVQRSPMDDIIDAEQGVGTRSSSVMAIKSIASKTNIVGNASSVSSSPIPEGDRRPAHQRQLSVKQQQDRVLFTQRPSIEQTPDSPRSEADGGEDRRDSSAWLRLSRQSGDVPPQTFDEPHQLPPEAHATTGTDLDNMITSYYTSDVAAAIQQDIRAAVTQANEPHVAENGGDQGNRTHNRVKGYRKIGIVGQFRILSVRTWRNLYRNPMLMLTHYAIAILLAVFLGFLFYGLTDDIPGFQNRLGLLFFVLALFGFSTLTSLTVFASERLIFVRERAKGYYNPLAYFTAKIIFDIVPLRLIPPIILAIIVYPMTGLVAAWEQFLIFVLFLVLFNFAAAAMCLFVGIVFRNGGVANLIGSLVMLFSLLFAGFLLNHDSIPTVAVWLQSISIFHYGFEGLIVNEVRYLSLTEHKWGLDIEVPGASILSSFGFNVQALVTDIIGLSVFTAAFIVLGYLAMHILLVERR
ncbi:hypothetical protein FH972_021496 [Carpinus fangiana]|uniref:ABC transporter domain-containing protein n=1 Tax=Carpinus fangiana TaxID=176857 RepID=A0A5N6KPV4_9ROSI|nr:hypothetical protein FH972_021496 [Carpinus fangiana]